MITTTSKEPRGNTQLPNMTGIAHGCGVAPPAQGAGGGPDTIRVFAVPCAVAARGLAGNHKKGYRIYCEEGLNLRSKQTLRRRAVAHRLARPESRGVNQCWSSPSEAST